MEGKNDEFIFVKLHKKVIQTHQLSVMLSGAISRQRQFVDQSIKKLISDLRSFCFLDTWYPRLSMSDVTVFLQSSIYLREKTKIFENPSSLPLPTTTTLPISTFMKSIHSYMTPLLKCAVLYFNTLSLYQTTPYIPCDKPLNFFASSTLPCLFGYCWCVEQGINYVHVLVELLQIQISKCAINSSEFRNSFLRDVIRQFLHMTDVQKYLRFALSTNYWTMINDEKLNTNENSENWICSILQYVKMFTSDLLGSMSHMPSLIRYFFYKVAEIDTSNLLVEFIFFDNLLQPALLNPKLFALIPETAAPTLSSNITTLTRIFKWSINPAMIPEKFNYIKRNIDFQELNVQLIISTLSNFDGKVNGMYYSDISDITEIRYNPILISVNDILFLTTIVNETIDNITDVDEGQRSKLKALCAFGPNLNLQNDELVDFWFQWFKMSEVPKGAPVAPKNSTTANNLLLPVIITNPIVQNFDKKDPYIKIIYHLLGYLQMVKLKAKSPPHLMEFLLAEKKRAIQTNSTEWLTRTQAIYAKLENSGKSEMEILNSLSDIIDDALKKSSSLLGASFQHQECSDTITSRLTEVSVMTDLLSPIIHRSLLRLFLQRNNDVKTNVTRSLLNYLMKVVEWVNFMEPMSQNITSFATALKLDSSQCFRLMRQFHSEICSKCRLTFADFMLVPNNNTGHVDALLNKKYDYLLKTFLREKFSNVLRQLFETPTCFESAINTLKKGVAAGAPLERLEQILSCINILKSIYMFESGEICLNDDLQSMFVYVLLRAKIEYLASLTNYLQHFLVSIEDHVNIMDQTEKDVLFIYITSTKYLITEAKK